MLQLKTAILSTDAVIFIPWGVGLTPGGIGLLATFSVVTTTDAHDATVGDGNCVSTLTGGECTLRAAIEEANDPPVDNDTIMVPENIYTLTLGELLLDSPVTIVGDGANKTIIDGKAAGQVLRKATPRLVLVAVLQILLRLPMPRLSSMIVSLRGFGGGIFNGDLSKATTLWLTNTTISTNTAANDGEGIANFKAGSATPEVNFKNSIIAGGCFDFNGLLTSHGNTCNLTLGSDITNTNPLLGPLQHNGTTPPAPTPHTETHALLVGSPALGAGDNAAYPATDQRGETRPAGDTDSDIGAYESVSISGGNMNVYLPIVIKA